MKMTWRFSDIFQGSEIENLEFEIWNRKS